MAVTKRGHHMLEKKMWKLKASFSSSMSNICTVEQWYLEISTFLCSYATAIIRGA